MISLAPLAIVLLSSFLLLTSSFIKAPSLSNWLTVQKSKIDKFVLMATFRPAVTDKSDDTKINQVLSEEQLRTFERDGVIVVRGLISGDQLKAAIEEVELVARGESEFVASYKNIKFHHWRTSKALKDVAFFSDVPKAAAQLIHQQSKKKDPVRLLKDAVLCFAPGGAGCGWHVDDKYFWPAEDESTGVNVWIALSPMPAKQGGGLAVAPCSHTNRVAQDAIPIIVAGGTCGMETLAPTVHEKLESMKVVYDMKPGDAILHDRWLFHRSDDFKSKMPEGTVLNRYSIRYMPDECIPRPDPVFENNGKQGRPMKEYGGTFPQVYPNAIAAEL